MKQITEKISCSLYTHMFMYKKNNVSNNQIYLKIYYKKNTYNKIKDIHYFIHNEIVFFWFTLQNTSTFSKRFCNASTNIQMIQC